MSDLLYEVNNHVGVIINRPDAMNSLTYQLYAELEDTVRSSEASLVITGNGRAFCAGDDMANQRLRNFVMTARWPYPCGSASYRHSSHRQRAAVGWGMELALMAIFEWHLNVPSSENYLL